MEFAVLLLVLLFAGQKELNMQDLPPLDLLKDGDWKGLVHSEWFQNQTLGSVSGKEIAQAADTLENFAKYGGALRPLLSGDFSALPPLSGADELFKNLGGLGALAQNMKGFGDLFSGSGTAAGTDSGERQTSETPFAPIANIADAEIIYALTRYFAA